MSWTKVEKEEGTFTKIDKTDVGWLVNGWLTFGWLLDSFYEKVSKIISNWTKVNKEE